MSKELKDKIKQIKKENGLLSVTAKALNYQTINTLIKWKKL